MGKTKTRARVVAGGHELDAEQQQRRSAMAAKITTEVAESEFDRFLEAMDIDVDPKGMDDEDKKSYQTARRRLVEAIEEGWLAVDEKGQPIVTPRVGDDAGPITFREPTGASYLAMDQKKKDHDQAKLVAVMADMTGQPPVRFSKMANRDLKLCQSIVALFLG
jgi:hypothetical protein